MEALFSSEQNPECQDVAIAESSGSGDALEVMRGSPDRLAMQWLSWLGGRNLNYAS